MGEGVRVRRIVNGIVVTCAVCVLGFAVGAGAAAPPQNRDGQSNERLRVVASPYALSLKLTPEEKQDPLVWQTVFNSAADVLRERYPDDFADAGVGPGKPWVSFKAAAPAGALELLNGLAIGYELRTGLGHSEQEYVDLTREVHDSVSASLPDGVVVTTAADKDRGVIVSTIDAKASAEEEEVRVSSTSSLSEDPNLESAVWFELQESALGTDLDRAGLSVEVQVDPSLSADTTTVYGGGSLSSCTAGFPVASGSRRGITTAGHCNNTQQYQGRNILTFQKEHWGSKGDYQWHSSSESVAARFYYSRSATRVLQRGATATPGTNVCKYGMSSGSSCDTVYQTGICITYTESGVHTCGLTRTHRSNSQIGDSGGPWYYGNTGYGLTSGSGTYLLIKRDYFTPINAAVKDLGISLVTG